MPNTPRQSKIHTPLRLKNRFRKSNLQNKTLQTSKSSFCSLCRRGHISDNCRSKLKCNFCHEAIAECRTRIAEEKQRSFFSLSLSEQTNQTTALLLSFQNKLVQSVAPPTPVPHYSLGHLQRITRPIHTPPQLLISSTCGVANQP